MNKLEFIYNRKSVRSFTEQPVPENDLEEIIKAATYAPSGKNKQNWHFVIVKNRQKVADIAKAVDDKNAALAALLDEEKGKALRGMAGYHTVFKKAPVVILAFAGPYPNVIDDFAGSDALSPAELDILAKPHPGVQNVAAAMENLLLAAAALGYGTCWMTGPTYAAAEIAEIIGFAKPGYYLVALTPLGVPAEGKYTNPPRKAVAEVITIID